MKATAEVLIRGYGNAWKVADASDSGPLVQLRAVELEIQSDGGTGYHLVMSPEGCFTADTWHGTLEEAKEAAFEAFGVKAGQWRTRPD